MRIHYDNQLKNLSRRLRKQGVLAEVVLWNEIKSKKLHGFQFMRQKPIGKFIVDFYCSRLNLVIEIDGESHSDRIDDDLQRQEFLESLGLTVLRFEDAAVLQDTSGVLDTITDWMQQNTKTTP